MKHPPDRPPEEPAPQDERLRGADKKEGEIDQALADSFPASDPPPWTLGIGTNSPSATPQRKRHRR